MVNRQIVLLEIFIDVDNRLIERFHRVYVRFGFVTASCNLILVFWPTRNPRLRDFPFMFRITGLCFDDSWFIFSMLKVILLHLTIIMSSAPSNWW